MENSVSTVIDSLPAEYRQVFVEVLGATDADLLAALLNHDTPSIEEREAVEDILSTEFSNHLRPDDEPTDRGVAIDSVLGAFLTRWPIEYE